MEKIAQIDAYWIAQMYHNTRKAGDFRNALHSVGVSRESANVLWHIIDAAIDIRPEAAQVPASTDGQQPAGQNVNESKDCGAVATSPDLAANGNNSVAASA